MHDAMRALVDMSLVAMLIKRVSLEAPLEIEEFEASKPSDTRITLPHSTTSSDSTTPLSPDHALAQTSPALTQASYYHSTARMAMRTQPTLSPSMYQGTSELVEDTEDESSDSDTKREGSEDEGTSSEDEGTSSEDEGYGSEDKGPGLEEEGEEATPEGQQQVVLVMDTATDEPLGLGIRALRCHELALGEGSVPSTFERGQNPVDGTVYTDIPVDVPPSHVPVQTPPSPEWSSGSLLVLPLSPIVPTPVASPVTTLVATIAVGKDKFLEVGAQLELHESILHDHTQRLDALPPTLFEGYDRDLRELYTRSRDVRYEIFSQRYRRRSLVQEQERATVTFSAIWRLVLALES
ncbi:hypothetical protein Tco_0925481 [Tanacetum coccineum]|uniref:Uncharacterized protein n=1 Tax=Tanacetum coccineum TaxID=301880 RepID=A0ABQ5D8B2_9ASTR